MTDPIVVKLPFFNLKYNTIKEGFRHDIELHPTHLLWTMSAYIDILPKPDDALQLVKEDQYINQNDFVIKSNLLYTQSYYHNDTEVWVLSLLSLGNSEPITDCKFETESDMREVEKVLHSWLLNQ